MLADPWQESQQELNKSGTRTRKWNEYKKSLSKRKERKEKRKRNWGWTLCRAKSGATTTRTCRRSTTCTPTRTSTGYRGDPHLSAIYSFVSYCGGHFTWLAMIRRPVGQVSM